MLTDIQKVAITKVGSKSPKIEEGVYDVDFLVRIKGTVRKGKDYPTTVYQSVPFDKLFAIALSKLNGVTVESIVREALSDEDNTEKIKEEVNESVRKLVNASEKIVNGKTTANLNIEIVEESIAA